MDEDWDLFAIVRSCQPATNNTTSNSSMPSSSTSDLKVELEYDAFSFPNIVQPITNEIQELNQLFTSFNPTNTTTTTSAHGINPYSPTHMAKCIGQQQHHLPPINSSSIWPNFVQEASTFNKFHNQHNQVQTIQKQEFQAPQIIQPQTPRSRKRYINFFQCSLIIEYFISLLKILIIYGIIKILHSSMVLNCDRGRKSVAGIIILVIAVAIIRMIFNWEVFEIYH